MSKRQNRNSRNTFNYISWIMSHKLLSGLIGLGILIVVSSIFFINNILPNMGPAYVLPERYETIDKALIDVIEGLESETKGDYDCLLQDVVYSEKYTRKFNGSIVFASSKGLKFLNQYEKLVSASAKFGEAFNKIQLPGETKKIPVVHMIFVIDRDPSTCGMEVLHTPEFTHHTKIGDFTFINIGDAVTAKVVANVSQYTSVQGPEQVNVVRSSTVSQGLILSQCYRYWEFSSTIDSRCNLAYYNMFYANITRSSDIQSAIANPLNIMGSQSTMNIRQEVYPEFVQWGLTQPLLDFK